MRHDHVAEIADGIFRIHTPVTDLPGGFSFNQYLVRGGDEALLFHAGPRALAGRVIEAVAHVTPLEQLRYIAFGHVEADECGGLNAILAAAPSAVPVCGRVGAMVQVNDLADRPPRALADGETLTLGDRRLTWIDAPHVPHGWDNGYLHDETSATLFCGDLFTQPGTGDAPVVEVDLLGPSEAFRAQMDYFAHAPATGAVLDRLAGLAPRTLACMHGSAYRGDGSAQLRALRNALSA
jgi:flavorubredoxin